MVYNHGRCYCPCVAEGIAPGSTVYCVLFYFIYLFILFVSFVLICLFSFCIYFKFWAVEQNLIPYVRQMVFAYIFYSGMECLPLCILILL